jgi:hypothetical protein
MPNENLHKQQKNLEGTHVIALNQKGLTPTTKPTYPKDERQQKQTVQTYNSKNIEQIKNNVYN